jgi:uncharacterized membrane protein
MNARYLIATALAGAIAAPALLSAQGPVPPPTAFKTEKCYGIAKAGKNDCASTGNNSCGGTSKLNGDKKAWIYVPAGYCDRIVGASLKPAEAWQEGSWWPSQDRQISRWRAR